MSRLNANLYRFFDSGEVVLEGGGLVEEEEEALVDRDWETNPLLQQSCQ